MWTMLFHEYKKVFRHPISYLALLFVLLLPFAYGYMSFETGYQASIDGVSVSNQVILDGKTYTGKDAYQKMQVLYASLEGEMNEAWFQDKKDQLQALNAENNTKDLSLKVMLKDALQLKPFTYGAMWNADADYMELFGHEASQEEREFSDFVVSEMNQISSFTYGSYQNWKFLMNCMSAFAVLFMVYIGIQGALIYNQEYSYAMMDEIKSGYIGKKKAGYAKLLVIVTLAICLPVIAILLYTFVTWLLFGLDNGAVTLAFYHAITPFTWQQTVIQGSFIILLGSLCIATLSMALSTTIKSSYVSTAFTMFFLILPLFLTIQTQGIMLSLLFPTMYVMLQNVFATIPFLTLGSWTLYYRDYAYLQAGSCSLLCCGYTIWKYRQYEH